jgi:hypothetical protein
MRLSMEQAADRQPSATFYFGVLAATLLLQLVLTGINFPLSRLGSEEHSWYIDNPYHVYQIELGRALLQQGLLTGLDPYFGAGHLGGVTYNVSARLPVLASALFPASLSTSALYAGYVLACSLAASLALPAMAWLLRWPAAAALAAAWAGLAFWWIGALRWYHTAGMSSFVCASYLGVLYGAWIWRICTEKRGGATWTVLAGLLGGLGLWMHPLFGLVVAALFVGFLAVGWRTLAWPGFLARSLGIAAIAVAINLPWLMAMTQTVNISAQSPYQKLVGWSVMVDPLLGKWTAGSLGSFLNPLAVMACAAALATPVFARRRALGPFVIGGAICLVFAAFGAASATVGTLQPNRFVAPGFLMFGAGAAFCAGAAASWLYRRAARPLRWGAGMVGLLLCLYVGREVTREATPGTHPHYGNPGTELSQTPARVAQLAAWLRANTTDEGRILFETSLGRIHGGGHAAGLLALAAEREFVGAAYPFSLPEVSFWDHAAFGVPINQVATAQFDAQLASKLTLLNVGWAVAHSRELVQALTRHAAAQQVAEIGVLRIFKIHQPLSYAQSGSVRVVARGFNRVEFADAAGGNLVLRYAWVPGLAATPPARIEPVVVAPDFPPLVRVVHPPSRFVLSTCADCAADTLKTVD